MSNASKSPSPVKKCHYTGKGNKSPGPGCSSTPSKKIGGNSPFRSKSVHRTSAFDHNSPPKKRAKLLNCWDSNDSSTGEICESFNNEKIKDIVAHSLGSQDCSKDNSKTSSRPTPDCNATVSVNLMFSHGGWDENRSEDGLSSCGLEIVESEAEVQSSPIKKERKDDIWEEDNPILSGMGEEIERQLEAKAARNRLTVPNVKNILRSVITNPLVLDMVKKCLQSGNVAVSGDLGDFDYEPRITRAKAKQLFSCVPEISGTAPKVSPNSTCHALISENLDDSEDDEEYKPYDDEHSDNDISERDGSERGSERDVSMDQLSNCFDGDNESCPPTPSRSPKTSITDSATQTNWSEDGVFKVPQVPSDLLPDSIKEENIALRTRSKLPLNDTPLEEIEQAFIPPDITPDLYDTTCDNADWQEFLKEFMQPMRSESHNNDDDEEDPEYNVLADEEIIDREELRMDRGVKVSKRELKELMRELLEFTDNMSSDDEDKTIKNRSDDNQFANDSPLSLQDDFSFLDSYFSSGAFNSCKTTPPSTPAGRSGSSGLNTPVPLISPPPPRTASSGKKSLPTNSPSLGKEKYLLTPPCSVVYSGQQILKEQNQMSFSCEKKESLELPCENDDYVTLGEENPMEKYAGKSPNRSIHSSPSKGKGKCRPVAAKSKTMKRRSAEKRVPHDSSLTDEENNSAFATVPVLKSNETSHIQFASAITPLKVEIVEPHVEDFHTDGITSSEQTLLCLSVPPEDCLEDNADNDIYFEACPLTLAQRLLLDQQMRQHVQLLTQHYMQCYQHPVHNPHAAGCKELLFTLKFLGESKSVSSFKPANLAPALETIEKWENVLSKEEIKIRSFWENEAEKLSVRRKSRHKYVEKFPLQFKEVIANSCAFVYPELLPPHPFMSSNCMKHLPNDAEIRLVAHGFEQFYPYVMELYPQKEKFWSRLTLELIREHLVPTKSESEMVQFFRNIQQRFKDNPVMHYLKHKQVPKTTHYVMAFNELQMKPVKLVSHDRLPKLWRDYIYPSLDSN